MMKNRTTHCAFWLCLASCLTAQTEEPIPIKKIHGKPALITPQDLADFDSLPADRQKLIERAIAVAKDSPWLPYLMGGSTPTAGGFDCSGAMFYVMRGVGLDPPRTSAQQFQWLRQNGRLHQLPPGVVDLKHPSLDSLKPGDLLFWGKTGVTLEPGITHVALYLGIEKKDFRPVMINSTDGRSYRGIQANGYGVYDFRLPSVGSKISFIGYGTPVGIALVKTLN
jgi:peptidoglycan DL-endopeptidase CwlO